MNEYYWSRCMGKNVNIKTGEIPKKKTSLWTGKVLDWYETLVDRIDESVRKDRIKPVVIKAGQEALMIIQSTTSYGLGEKDQPCLWCGDYAIDVIENKELSSDAIIIEGKKKSCTLKILDIDPVVIKTKNN